MSGGEAMATESDKRVLFTIGHSNHDWPTFLALLQRHGVTAVADVRSQPVARLPQFNHKELEIELKHADVEYVFLGRELGARREEPECYDEGCAVYERVAELPMFRTGLERVLKGLQRHRIALMCAEQEPTDCHRTVLVCRRLRHEPIEIQHILADGQLEAHLATERRLIRMTGVGRTLFEPDLTDDEILDRAYLKRGREIAFRVGHEEAAP